MVFVMGGAGQELRSSSHFVTLDVIVELRGALLQTVTLRSLLLLRYLRGDLLSEHGQHHLVGMLGRQLCLR